MPLRQQPRNNTGSERKKSHEAADLFKKRPRLLDSVGEGEGGMIGENGIEIRIMSYMEQVASPGSMHDTG